MRRGAATGLWFLRDHRALDPLLTASANPSVGMRWDTARALGTLGDGRAVERLVGMLRDADMQVRWRAAEALGAIGTSRALRRLRDEPSAALPSEAVKQAAATAIERMAEREHPQSR